MEGVRLLAANCLEAAENQFTESLKLLPDRASTLSNLSAVKLKQHQFSEAEIYARRAVAADENSAEAWANLGMALVALNRHEEALPACNRALAGSPGTGPLWHTKATVLSHLKHFDEALAASEEAIRRDPHQPDFLHLKSVILKETGRAEDAKKIYRRAFELSHAANPVVLAPRRATQKAHVLILNHNPDIDADLRSYEDLHLHCSNFPGQFVDHLLDEFHFSYLFAGPLTGVPERIKIPPPDFVVNNHTNGEVIRSEGSQTQLVKLLETFRVPVVNRPEQAVQTTRDIAVERLQGVPDAIIPATRRFSTEGKSTEALRQEIEEHFDYPLITRPPATQRGIGMSKVDSPDDLMKILAGSEIGNTFFVTQFVDSRGGNEFYRKIRAAIVRDDIILVRSDYNTHWNIHGRKSAARVPFYLEHRYLLDEERRICLDPETALGRRAMQALRAIRSRIPLDVFGMDFDVDAEGRVVFYEANATMNLFSTAQKPVPNPKEADDALNQAFRRYFRSLAARG